MPLRSTSLPTYHSPEKERLKQQRPHQSIWSVIGPISDTLAVHYPIRPKQIPPGRGMSGPSHVVHMGLTCASDCVHTHSTAQTRHADCHSAASHLPHRQDRPTPPSPTPPLPSPRRTHSTHSSHPHTQLTPALFLLLWHFTKITASAPGVHRNDVSHKHKV